MHGAVIDLCSTVGQMQCLNLTNESATAGAASVLNFPILKEMNALGRGVVHAEVGVNVQRNHLSVATNILRAITNLHANELRAESRGKRSEVW